MSSDDEPVVADVGGRRTGSDDTKGATRFGSGFERLRAWALDEAHTIQSVRMHEPTYRNPAELRADVRELLARYDAVVLYRLRTEGVLDAD